MFFLLKQPHTPLYPKNTKNQTPHPPTFFVKKLKKWLLFLDMIHNCKETEILNSLKEYFEVAATHLLILGFFLVKKKETHCPGVYIFDIDHSSLITIWL